MEILKTITIINQKGGVGKSTTALSVGVGLSRKGFRVLFVDLDAQGNLSYVMGADRRIEVSDVSSMDVISRRISVKQAIRCTEQGEVIRSSSALAWADIAIVDVGKEYRLKESMEPLVASYDFVIIDTPPALGILTVNALTASTGCIIPSQADVFSLQGIQQLNETIETVRRYCNPALKIMGIVLTRFNSRVVIGREISDKLEEIASQMGTKLYTSTIRECTAIKESQVVRQDIWTYAPRSNAATDYSALVSEILEEE